MCYYSLKKKSYSFNRNIVPYATSLISEVSLYIILQILNSFLAGRIEKFANIMIKLNRIKDVSDIKVIYLSCVFICIYTQCDLNLMNSSIRNSIHLRNKCESRCTPTLSSHWYIRRKRRRGRGLKSNRKSSKCK